MDKDEYMKAWLARPDHTVMENKDFGLGDALERLQVAENLSVKKPQVTDGARIYQAAKKMDEEKRAKAGETGEAASMPAVSFEDVSLTYPGGGEEALSNITFSASDGQTIGIIGGTGCGKSSLVNLIPRFYDVTGGRVLVYGKDVRDYEKGALHKLISVVPQKAALFAGSIAENLRWGREQASEEELLEASEMAQASDVLEAKGGLSGMVEQGGRNLSGGQRQRLTIARALVSKKPILILDDSFSALDMATDQRLRTALRGMEKRPLTFIVSQRTKAIQDADLILVLDNGRLVASGTHEALLADCPLYREIHESQAGPSEEVSA